jgi:hypothetical protein
MPWLLFCTKPGFRLAGRPRTLESFQRLGHPPRRSQCSSSSPKCLRGIDTFTRWVPNSFILLTGRASSRPKFLRATLVPARFRTTKTHLGH